MKLNHADVYTDFNGLAKLKNEARNHSQEAIKEVAKQFESVFLNMVLKSMRQAKLSDGLLDNDQSEFYRQMYDQQLALHLSGEPGIGLADLMARQLSPEPQVVRQPMAAEDYLNRSAKADVRPHSFRSNGEASVPPPSSTQSGGQEFKLLPMFADKVQDAREPLIVGKEQFVAQLRPYAEQAAAELGVDAGVLLAQAALETGWGRSVLQHADGESSHNLFNIKADRSWQGKQLRQKTLEFDNGIGRQEFAAFRSYDSYRESFADYVRFVKGNPRYANAVKMAGNPERYMHELQQAGYATDPAYAAKVMRIFHGDMIGGATTMAMK